MKIKPYLLKTNIAVMLVFIPVCLLSYKFDIVTVGDIVKKVQNRFTELETYQASFVITSEKLGKRKVQRGVLKYKADDMLRINFYNPQGQTIVSNGKMLWIYIPSMNVVAEQDLKSGSGIFASHSKSGLKRLFSKYHYRFDSKKQPEEQKSGKKLYTLFLKQKESRSGFRTMKLWISEDFLIQKAYGTTSSGKKVEIVFSKIKLNKSLANGLFKFDIPSRARVIKNPMIAEE